MARALLVAASERKKDKKHHPPSAPVATLLSLFSLQPTASRHCRANSPSPLWVLAVFLHPSPVICSPCFSPSAGPGFVFRQPLYRDVDVCPPHASACAVRLARHHLVAQRRLFQRPTTTIPDDRFSQRARAFKRLSPTSLRRPDRPLSTKASRTCQPQTRPWVPSLSFAPIDKTRRKCKRPPREHLTPDHKQDPQDTRYCDFH